MAEQEAEIERGRLAPLSHGIQQPFRNRRRLTCCRMKSEIQQLFTHPEPMMPFAMTRNPQIGQEPIRHSILGARMICSVRENHADDREMLPGQSVTNQRQAFLRKAMRVDIKEGILVQVNLGMAQIAPIITHDGLPPIVHALLVQPKVR